MTKFEIRNGRLIRITETPIKLHKRETIKLVYRHDIEFYEVQTLIDAVTYYFSRQVFKDSRELEDYVRMALYELEQEKRQDDYYYHFSWLWNLILGFVNEHPDRDKPVWDEELYRKIKSHFDAIKSLDKLDIKFEKEA